MTNSHRQETIAAIERERSHWNTLVEGAKEHLDAPPVTDSWSFREIAGHLLGWRMHSVVELEAEANHQTAPPPPWPANASTDEINAWIDAQQRTRSANDILADYDRCFDRMIAVVETMPEADLTDPNRFPSLEGQSLHELLANGDYFGHLREEHEPDILRWLAEISPSRP